MLKPVWTIRKGAVLQLGRGLAVDWGRYGIRVNVVAPGVIDTPLNARSFADPERIAYYAGRAPLGRHGTADEVLNNPDAKKYYFGESPVTSSPRQIACCTGAAPRHWGSSEKWRFTQPWRGMSSAAAGTRLP